MFLKVFSIAHVSEEGLLRVGFMRQKTEIRSMQLLSLIENYFRTEFSLDLFQFETQYKYVLQKEYCLVFTMHCHVGLIFHSEYVGAYIYSQHLFININI